MNEKWIGLTGPTGAGKSEVARVLVQMGCVIVDADRTAREVTAEPECLQALAEAFGADVLWADGTLNRKMLARRAFASREQEKRLNAITHPRIIARMKQAAKQGLDAGAPAVVLDAPLLYESGLDQLCGTVIAVIAPPELRLGRICTRDGISEEEARMRMSVQQPDAFYTERAQQVFRNEGSPDALGAAVKKWWLHVFCKEADA